MKTNEQGAKEELLKRAKQVTPSDIQKVFEREEEIKSKFQSAGPLKKFFSDFLTFISLIKDYVTGKYTQIPFWIIAAIVAAILYVLSPVDLIPDFIPGLGYVDDGLVMAACIKMIERDLTSYKAWKEKSA